jgi:S-adenosylmethionine decarboxylase
MGTVYAPFGFEGPEKKLEIDFQPVAIEGDLMDAHQSSLRTVPRCKWEQILTIAQCNILSMLQNECCDAYLLSESSMFVYDRKVMIKTCGTTSLLRTIPELIAVGQALGFEIGFLQYSRTAFRYPEYQPAPHQSFRDEIAFLRQYLPSGTERVMSDGSSIPAAQRMAWHVFTYDNQKVSTKDQCLEVCMFDLDPLAMRYFFGDAEEHGGNADTCTSVSGIEDLLRFSQYLERGSEAVAHAPLVDAHLFSPCGYSMNALDGSTYYTIHITPEDHCSYVSFESNAHFDTFITLLGRVLDTFRPARYQVAFLGDEHSPGALAARDWPKYLRADAHHFIRRDALGLSMRPAHEDSSMIWRHTGPFSHWIASSATYQRIPNKSMLHPSVDAYRLVEHGHPDGWSSPVSGDSWSTQDTPSLCSDSERELLEDMETSPSTALDASIGNISVE